MRECECVPPKRTKHRTLYMVSSPIRDCLPARTTRQNSWVVRAWLSGKGRWLRGVEILGDPPADDEPPRWDSIEEGEVAMALVATGFE